LTREEEEEREEGVCNVFWKDELVEFITQIYRIDVVAFQVREHDDEENHREKKPCGHEHRKEE